MNTKTVPMRMSRALVALTIALLALTLTACVDNGPHGSRTSQPPLHPGVNSITFEHRASMVHIPAGTTAPVPLVLVLHELSGNGAVAMAYGFDPLVDSEGFVAVYPDGTDGSWNAGSCCGTAAGGVDDVAYLTALVQHVEKLTAVDPKRVFATGFSNGAMMSYRLACDSKLFAAIAPMSGDVMTPCEHPVAASVLHVNGLADDDVPYDAAADDPWRTVDRCRAPKLTTNGGVHTSLADCADGRAVEVVTIDGMAHQVATTANGFDAAARVWAFFAAHPGP